MQVEYITPTNETPWAVYVRPNWDASESPFSPGPWLCQEQCATEEEAKATLNKLTKQFADIKLAYIPIAEPAPVATDQGEWVVCSFTASLPWNSWEMVIVVGTYADAETWLNHMTASENRSGWIWLASDTERAQVTRYMLRKDEQALCLSEALVA